MENRRKKQKFYIERVYLTNRYDSCSLQSFGSPVVAPHSFLFAETTGSTTMVTYMVSASAAASTHNVDNFALALAH
jgi:hypothetical protein